MTYGLAVDNWQSTVGTAHTAGDGQIVLAALNGLPALTAGRIYRLTAVAAPDTPTEAVLGVFQATGLTGMALTGVTAATGYSDVNLAAGVAIQIRVCKATIQELQAALDTLYSTAAFLAGAAFTGNVTAPQYSTSGNLYVSGKAVISGGASDNTIQMGTMGIQAFATNNCWFADNLYFNGGAFVYAANGYGVLFRFIGGNFTISMAGNNSLGPNATATLNNAITVGGDGGFTTYAYIVAGSRVIVNSPTGSPEIRLNQDSNVGWNFFGDATGHLYFQATTNGFAASTMIFSADNSASITFYGALKPAALADAAAPNSSIYLGSGHLDANSAPKLCRKDAAGNVTVIG